jgi:hypothetical protein
VQGQRVTWTGTISREGARDLLTALRDHQAKSEARCSERASKERADAQEAYHDEARAPEAYDVP